MAAADSFDAMTHERPYRQPTSIEIALAEMERERGWQFDPDVVDALLRAIGWQEDREQYGLNPKASRTIAVLASHPATAAYMNWMRAAQCYIPPR